MRLAAITLCPNCRITLGSRTNASWEAPNWPANSPAVMGDRVPVPGPARIAIRPVVCSAKSGDNQESGCGEPLQGTALIKETAFQERQGDFTRVRVFRFFAGIELEMRRD